MVLDCAERSTVIAICPAERAQQILHDSPYYALQQLACSFEGGTLVIGGRVPSHYLKQLAQTAVQRVSGIQQIRNLIEVSV
jgi:BON domain